MTINRVPYRISLRVLGRLLNGDKARMVTLCEIEEGFLLHYFRQGEPRLVANRAIHSAEVMDLDDMLQKQRGKPATTGPFKALGGLLGFQQDEALRFQKTHPLCPMGYEAFLRALGGALDRRNAQAVLITELDDRIHVEYTVDRSDFVVRNGQRMALAGRRQESYPAAEIKELVLRSRETAVDQVRRSGQQLAFNPMDVASYLNAASVLADHGQQREAEDLYRKILSLAPQHPEAHYQLACYARRRGDHKAALKHLHEAIDADDGEGRFFHLLGRVYIERRQLDQALEALEQAVACDPGNNVYHFHLSQVYERLGRTDEARLAREAGEAYAGGGKHVADLDGLWDGADERAPAAEHQTAPAVAHQTTPAVAHQTTPAADHQAASAAPSIPAQAAGDAARNALPAGMPAFSSTPATHDAGYGETMMPATALPNSVEHGGGGVEDQQWSSQASWTVPSLPLVGEPGWQSGASLPVHTGLPGLPATAPAAATDGHAGLPVLGLSAVTGQPAAALPALEVPADAAAAAAALPLSGISLPQSASAMSEPPRVDATFTTAALPDVAAAAEPAAPSGADEAVQLAAAILRAEELVRAEPTRADLHRKLGFLLARQGRTEEAASAFRRAVECGRPRMAS